MEKLKQKAIALVEGRFIRTATVLAIRAWEPGTFREIDLHMPDCNMEKWNSTQQIKCKVGPLTYRDYTPSGWDVETRTCTLFMHAAHEGPGSRWVKMLQPGDTIQYLGVSSSHQQPAVGKRMIFLGDETAIGHFLALRQLSGEHTTISGAILLGEHHHRNEFLEYFPGWQVEGLYKKYATDYKALEEWIDGLPSSGASDIVFYLAGHNRSVGRLRKLLRQKGWGGSQVKAQGFWE